MVDKLSIPAKTRLERFRKAQGIRLKRLVEGTGIARNQLYDYRMGRNSPTIALARKLRKGLTAIGYPCKMNDLFPLDDDD